MACPGRPEGSGTYSLSGVCGVMILKISRGIFVAWYFCCHLVNSASIIADSALQRKTRLTLLPFHHYSGGMISDFEQLSEKIQLLADLAQSLRRENADLRLRAAALGAENVELTQRMQLAQQRVSALLAAIPATVENQELA